MPAGVNADAISHEDYFNAPGEVRAAEAPEAGTCDRILPHNWWRLQETVALPPCCHVPSFLAFQQYSITMLSTGFLTLPAWPPTDLHRQAGHRWHLRLLLRAPPGGMCPGWHALFNVDNLWCAGVQHQMLIRA